MYLGSTLDYNLSWKGHIKEIKEKVNQVTEIIQAIGRNLTPTYNIHLKPVLQYRTSFWT